MSAFTAYFLGSLAIAVALAVGLTLLGVPPLWTGVGALVIIGLGLMGGAAKTKRKDMPES